MSRPELILSTAALPPPRSHLDTPLTSINARSAQVRWTTGLRFKGKTDTPCRTSGDWPVMP